MNREIVHWTTIVGTLAAAVATLATVGGGTFWAGLWMGQKEAQLQIAELRLAKSQLEENYKQSQQTISEKSKQIEQISSELARANPCVFIQKRIREIEKQIASRMSSFVFGEVEGAERKPKQRDELENQLADYKEKLGTCNR